MFHLDILYFCSDVHGDLAIVYKGLFYDLLLWETVLAIHWMKSLKELGVSNLPQLQK